MTTYPQSPAIEQAHRHYAAQGLSLAEDLQNYSTWGSVIITPTRLILGRAILRANGIKWVLPGAPVDTWFIKYACGEGAMQWFYQQMPFPLPFIAWSRDFRTPGQTRELRFYPTSRLHSILNAA